MKHRNVCTLEGGKNMQQKSLGRVLRYLTAVLVVLSLFALLGCSDDDDDDEAAVFDLTNAVIPVTATTVTAVQGQAIIFPSGAVFNAGPTPLTVTFTSPSTATITRGTQTATANVSFASCTFTLVSGGGLLTGGPFVFPTCNFQINAQDVEQGGEAETGTLVLVLVGPTGSVTSTPINVQVIIRVDGVILINNVVTPADVDAGTGVSGVTGG